MQCAIAQPLKNRAFFFSSSFRFLQKNILLSKLQASVPMGYCASVRQCSWKTSLSLSCDRSEPFVQRQHQYSAIAHISIAWIHLIFVGTPCVDDVDYMYYQGDSRRTCKYSYSSRLVYKMFTHFMTLAVDITVAHVKTQRKMHSFFEMHSLQENRAFHEVPLFMHPQQLLLQQNSSQLSIVGNLAARLGVCTPEVEINGHANTTCLKQSALDTAENIFLGIDRLQHVTLILYTIVIVAEHLVACPYWQIKDTYRIAEERKKERKKRPTNKQISK